MLIAQISLLDAHHDVAIQALPDAVDEDLVVHGITLAEVLVGDVRLGGLGVPNRP